jgi:hypothetical protein
VKLPLWMDHRSYLWRPILWMAVVLHLTYGIALILDAGVARITALAAVVPHAIQGVAIGLILVAELGAWALTRRAPSMHTLAALLPQQGVLTFSAVSALYYVAVGHYGDGVPRSHLFILADQAPVILLALLHPWGLLRMHADIPRPTKEDETQ